MSTRSLATTLLLLTLALRPPALAQTPPAAQPLEAGALEALEREFWFCDHAATQALLDPGTSERCGLVTDTLKTVRFGGDFQAMLTWWRENKDARHAALSAASAQQLVGASPRRPAMN